MSIYLSIYLAIYTHTHIYIYMYIHTRVREYCHERQIAQSPSVQSTRIFLAIAPDSPCWHRSLRRRRAKARLRIRTAKRLGIRPRDRDLRRVILHHSAPPHLRYMGKAWRHKGHGQEQQPKGSGKRWDYWPGAWSPGRKQQDQWRSEKDSGRGNFSFPRYDEQRVDLTHPSTQMIEIHSQRDQAPRSLTGGLQSLINHTRRMEQKQRSLEEARKQRLAQWEKYERDLTKAYKNEKERHLRLLTKIEDDLAQVKQQSEQAQGQLVQAATAAGYPTDAAISSDEPVDLMSAMGAGNPATSLPALDISMEEIMMLRALRRQGAESALPRPDLESHGRESTHPVANPTPVEVPPPGLANIDYSALSPGARRARAEPYPSTSPDGRRPTADATAGHTRSLPRHTAQRDQSQVRVPTNVEQPRPGIKEAAMKPPPKAAPPHAIQAKLEERRAQELGRALRPFGMEPAPVPGAPPTEGPAPPPLENGPAAAANIVDDDDEMKSPGFLGME